MSTPSARAWRAACPNCGAPVEFRSAASASAVCGYCRSTLVRDGEALRRIGQSAELFDDFTPLQLGAGGRFQGVAFQLVGRLQFGTADGPWNEWHAVFDNGRDGWLSEDNGRYVFAFDLPTPADAPRPEALHAGAPARVDGRPWSVGSVVQATLIAAEGELLQPPPQGRAFTVADLRNAADEVGTLEWSDPAAPRWSIGRSVNLSDLRMSGLRETASEKTLQAQAVPCPNCGAALAITLATTRSVVCGNCKSVVDLSQGVGPAMAHYAQANPHEPALPIGRTGQLAVASGAPVLAWQIVGYMERCELAQGVEPAEAWREYLLWNRIEGFAFLVDTNEGWSVVRTLTGAPQVQGDVATWYGAGYRRRWTYASVVTYVLGEFYWHVEAHQRTEHQDYAAAASGHTRLLSLERTAGETTWSGGESIAAEAVAAAFGLPAPAAAQLARGGPPPLDAILGSGRLLTWPALLGLLLIVVVLLAMCSHDACADQKRLFGSDSLEYRQCRARSAAGATTIGTGGAWGGYSSGGGGHK